MCRTNNGVEQIEGRNKLTEIGTNLGVIPMNTYTILTTAGPTPYSRHGTIRSKKKVRY